MALLTEGGHYSLVFYKHGPPDGGRARVRAVSINMALPTEVGPESAWFL